MAACVLGGLCSLQAAFGQEQGWRERGFIQALELFDKAKTPDDYRAVAALLESLLAQGYENGAVYFNLGNAYMRAGEYGQALAAYRKAKLYRPRDQNLEANLKQALASAPGRLAEGLVPWWKHVLFWSTLLSYPEKMAACCGVFCLGALLAAGALWRRSRRLYHFSLAAVLIACLLGAEAALAWYEINCVHHAVVIKEVVARKGMGAKYEPAFDQPLKDGAEFSIIDRSGDWVFGHFEGIGDGWLHRDAVVER